MNRSYGLAALFALTLAAAPAAQTLMGTFQLDGNADFTMVILPSPFGPGFVGQPYLRGQPIEGEFFYAFPIGDRRYKVENLRGNKSEVVINSEGHLEFEMKSGPNTGRKTLWIRK